MAKPGTSLSINSLAHSSRFWTSKPPWTMGKRFCLSGLSRKKSTQVNSNSSKPPRFKNYSSFLPFVGFDASVQPSNGPMPGFFESRGISVSGIYDVIQLHHDIGSNGGLDFDGVFGG